MTVVELVLSAVAIVVAAALFTNAVEILGERLALGNITGAMVFQSSVPVALGLAFTSWRLDVLNILAVALALAGGAYLYLLLRRNEPVEGEYLLVGGALYVVFAAVVIFTIL